jgi:predicted AlkP superfamily phosphohydrolase/phosphomutase
VIPSSQYEAVREELSAKLAAICNDKGQPLATRVYKPEAVYRATKNIPPDLIVLFGDLGWRAVGSLGLGALHTFENDTGPDDANHAQQGLFIDYDPKSRGGGRELSGLQLYDIAPTVLQALELEVPKHMIGRVVDGWGK